MAPEAKKEFFMCMDDMNSTSKDPLNIDQAMKTCRSMDIENTHLALKKMNCMIIDQRWQNTGFWQIILPVRFHARAICRYVIRKNTSGKY